MAEIFYDVILEKADYFHTFTSNVISETFGFTGPEANNIASSAPCTLRKNLTKEDAETLVQRLKAASAEASIKESADSGSGERYSVFLEAKGPNLFQTANVLMKAYDLSLMQAKKLLDKTPGVVRANLTKEDAEALKARFEAIGATVTLKPYDSSKPKA